MIGLHCQGSVRAWGSPRRSCLFQGQFRNLWGIKLSPFFGWSRQWWRSWIGFVSLRVKFLILRQKNIRVTTRRGVFVVVFYRPMLIGLRFFPHFLWVTFFFILNLALVPSLTFLRYKKVWFVPSISIGNLLLISNRQLVNMSTLAQSKLELFYEITLPRMQSMLKKLS